jgi:antitoxin VapB
MCEGDIVDTAKVFMSGNSQAVRLPKEYRLSGDEVAIKRLGNAIVLLPRDDPWQIMFDALEEFSEDLEVDREQPPVQERPPLA